MNIQPSKIDENVLERRYAQLDQVRLHYVAHEAAGPDAPLVVLLHGFPDFWYTWRFQIEPLAQAGLRVVAPDMRGYALSDKPSGVANYRLERLADDIAQLIEQLGANKASVVGHDWGGMVAWTFAMRHPDKLERLGILNAPHPAHMLRMMTNPKQLVRSSYIFFFQLPQLPERTLERHNFRGLRRFLRRASTREEAFTETDIDRYVEAFRGGALTTMLDYYRALLRRDPLALRRSLTPIDKPTMVLWGQRDPFLGERYAAPPSRWVRNLRVARLPEAGHWVHMDAAERVNVALCDFLAPPSAAQ